MLPYNLRLRSNSEIADITKRGKRVSGEKLKIYYRDSDRGYTRVACVVGKKVSKLAVRRHKLQRWLREVARQEIKNTLSAWSYDMVWVALPSANALNSLADVRQEVALLIRLINNHNESSIQKKSN
jgi:ribonuclease P protein component